MFGAWGIEEAIVIGYSMGAMVALELALKYPAKVKALVSICGVYGRPLDYLHGHNTMAKMLPLLLGVASVVPDSWLVRGWESFIGSDTCVTLFGTGKGKQIRDNLIPYFAHMTSMHPKAFIYTLAATQEYSLEDRLKEIKQPTLLLAGESDLLSPPFVVCTMSAELPNASMHVIDGTHILPLEQPELVQGIVSGFLEGV
jgi:pimeloyl-ACP methyl ester carboxylesterase